MYIHIYLFSTNPINYKNYYKINYISSLSLLNIQTFVYIYMEFQISMHYSLLLLVIYSFFFI